MARYVVVYAHPIEDSLCAEVRRIAVDRLSATGQSFAVHDLYQDAFDPVLAPAELAEFRAGRSGGNVKHYTADLVDAAHLILIFPTWWYGMPAILKGYFDRVWSPEIAFRIDEHGRLGRARLAGIRTVTIATTGGSPWSWMRIIMREPARRTLTTGLLPCLARGCRFRWLACYGLDRPSSTRIVRFLRRFTRVLRALD